MLKKIVQNKKTAVIGIVLLIIAITAGVLVSYCSQEHHNIAGNQKKEASLEKETDNVGADTKKETENQNTGFEIVEDESKTQTESVDAPTSWEATEGMPVETQPDGMPVETQPDDGEIEYGSIF